MPVCPGGGVSVVGVWPCVPPPPLRPLLAYLPPCCGYVCGPCGCFVLAAGGWCFLPGGWGHGTVGCRSRGPLLFLELLEPDCPIPVPEVWLLSFWLLCLRVGLAAATQHCVITTGSRQQGWLVVVAWGGSPHVRTWLLACRGAAGQLLCRALLFFVQHLGTSLLPSTWAPTHSVACVLCSNCCFCGSVLLCAACPFAWARCDALLPSVSRFCLVLP